MVKVVKVVKVEAGTSPGGHDWDLIKGMVIVVVVMVEDGIALHLGRDCDNCDNDYGMVMVKHHTWDIIVMIMKMMFGHDDYDNSDDDDDEGVNDYE